MKNFLLLPTLFFFSFSTANAGLIYVPVLKDNKKTEAVTFQDAIKKMDAKTFLSLTQPQIKLITGERMSFKEKVVLKFAQKEVKKNLKNNKQVNISEVMLNANGTFEWGAYLLGVFLLLIGVLIVYLTNWEDPKVARKSAWKGLVTGFILFSGIIRLLSI